LIGEVFGTIGHAAGGQGGVRWSPGPQKIDIDLRGSHGSGPLGDAVTLGLTVRF
jgi:hypothetical protein